jgi:hypothetical protein
VVVAATSNDEVPRWLTPAELAVWRAFSLRVAEGKGDEAAGTLVADGVRVEDGDVRRSPVHRHRLVIPADRIAADKDVRTEALEEDVGSEQFRHLVRLVAVEGSRPAISWITLLTASGLLCDQLITDRSALGVAEICKAAGMPKGCFSYFFGSKGALAPAVIHEHWDAQQ